MLKNFIETGKLYNVSSLSKKYAWDSSYKGSGAFSEPGARLLNMAAGLPKDEYLGMDIYDIKNDSIKCDIFTSAASGASQNDLGWIFNGVADLSDSQMEKTDDFFCAGKKIYIVSCSAAHAESRNFPEIRQYKDLIRSIADTGAVIRIIITSVGNNREVSGLLLISFPEIPPLRTQTSMTMTFPRGTITGLDEAARDGFKISGMPLCDMTNILPNLLAAAAPGIDGPEEDDFEDDYISELVFTPIEELAFSVRTYNCLKRAGIDYVETLDGMTDEELKKVRNLGRKSYAEVKEKLINWIITYEAPTAPAAINKEQKDYGKMLDKLIGLEEVKKQVKRIEALARMKQDMKEKGQSVPVTLNMEFAGTPGTAKTTVARILAGILQENGLISDSTPVEVGRADLVAKYVGQTADKVKSVFERAKGRLLFIDEAYSLFESREGEFGDEAINTIVQEMENNREDTVVIFAGYPGEMEKLFSRNPGLRSRVPFKITFKDYSAEEMAKIAELEAEKRGFTIGSKEKVLDACKAAVNSPETGNGRFCRNLVENAILNYALRVYGDDAKNGDKDMCLLAEDFAEAVTARDMKESKTIGFRGAA